MKLSVITACRNNVSTLTTALDSLLRQQGADYELLVQDGLSTDGTLDLFHEWEPRFNGRLRLVSEPDAGLYDALNKAITRASGDLIVLLHADDILNADDVLARWRAPFLEDPSLDAVYGDIRFIPRDAATRDAPTRRYYAGNFWRPWMLRWGLIPPHPSFAIRREVILRLGGYRTDMRIAADHEFLVRLFRSGARAHYLPFCTTAMRLGGLSTDGLQAKIRLNREIVRANRLNGIRCCLPMMVPKYAYKVFELLRRTP